MTNETAARPPDGDATAWTLTPCRKAAGPRHPAQVGQRAGGVGCPPRCGRPAGGEAPPRARRGDSATPGRDRGLPGGTEDYRAGPRAPGAGPRAPGAPSGTEGSRGSREGLRAPGAPSGTQGSRDSERDRGLRGLRGPAVATASGARRAAVSAAELGRGLTVVLVEAGIQQPVAVGVTRQEVHDAVVEAAAPQHRIPLKARRSVPSRGARAAEAGSAGPTGLRRTRVVIARGPAGAHAPASEHGAPSSCDRGKQVPEKRRGLS